MKPESHEPVPVICHPDLEHWRALARDNPHDSGMREQLAEALSKSVLGVENLEEQRLEELRAVVVAHPQDAPVRKWFARALYSVLFFERQEKELARSDAIFQELRELSNAHPGDAGVAEPFAMALSYVHGCTKEGDYRPVQAGLLQELRELSNLHPNSREVQMWLRATTELEAILDSKS